MIRVLLVHDTHLLRSALAALLGRERDLEVVTTAWHNAALNMRSQRPRVCVVDVDCPGSAALTSVAELTRIPAAVSAWSAVSGHPRPPAGTGGDCALLVLATPSKPGQLRRASQARALGYVNKDAAPEGLPHAIRQVAAGERFVDNTLAFDFLQAAHMPLTPREFSVLTLAAEGASVAEIARSLYLTAGTVRNYMAAITRKTGARNRVDAIRISRGAGWL